MPATRQRASGFTLWELLCALSLAGIVVGLGVPAMQDVVLDARRLGAVNSLVAAARFARSEAQKRGRTVVLCASSDLHGCTGALDYGLGWIVFENSDRDSPPSRAADEPLLRAERPTRVRAEANRAAFEFRPFPLRSTNGTVTLCDARGAAHTRSVVVSYTGRPRVTADPSSRCGAPS